MTISNVIIINIFTLLPPRPIFSLNYTTKPKEFVPKNSTGVDVPRFEVTFVKVLFLLSNDKLWLSGRYGEGILIHSKSEKVCGVCFSVSKHLRKKCINLDNNILRHMCVNHPNSKNFVSKGHFCCGYSLLTCFQLRFKQWMNIVGGVFQFYLCALSQYSCKKFKIIRGVQTPGTLTFRMYDLTLW